MIIYIKTCLFQKLTDFPIEVLSFFITKSNKIL